MKLNSNHILSAIMLAAFWLLAGCADDSFLGHKPSEGGTVVPEEDTVAISFGSNSNVLSRASSAASAALLGGQFYLYGDRVTLTDGVEPVFDNYQIRYKDGYSALSGFESDWQYMGLTSKRGITQGLKYWDFDTKQYRFVAFAGLPEDQLITSTTDDLRLKVTDVESTTNLYIADRITATPMAQAATATTAATQAYADVVNFQFRRMAAQMRIGFYETIPGYAVKDLIFYFIGAPSGSREVGVGTAFPQSGHYTVSFDDATNQAHATFVGADNAMAFSQTFGELQYTSALCAGTVPGKPYIDAHGHPSTTPDEVFLGTNSTETTFGKGFYTIDGQSGVASTYRPILPNEHNSLTLQLRVDYTLVSLDGKGEEIHVRDACARVPIEYLQWEPNHAYTYIFKISDNSNGYTGLGGGGEVTTGPGRDPAPDDGGGDRDPSDRNGDGIIDPPYIPDPSWPLIPNPDYDPSQPTGPDNPVEVTDPAAPYVPNPLYPTGPAGDQGDPSNPIPTPADVTNPSELWPITFDAIIVEDENGLVHEEEIKK